MSEAIRTTSTNAASFNRKSVPKLLGMGVYSPLPSSIGDSLFNIKPELAGSVVADLFSMSSDSLGFAEAVKALQREVFGFSPQDVDGKFGRKTWVKLLSLVDSISSDEQYILFGDRRHPLSLDNGEVVCFDKPDGLDLHRRGHFSRRKRPINQVVLHWGGLDPHHFYNVAMSQTRKISSHFAIGMCSDGVVRVYQLLDLEHKAWHAGKFNEGSVGIDICQQADRRWKKHYHDSLHHDCFEEDNISGRGPKRVLSLDTDIRDSTVQFLDKLLKLLGRTTDLDLSQPIPTTNAHAVKKFDNAPLVGHHHLAPHKWDIAPWWNTIRDHLLLTADALEN